MSEEEHHELEKFIGKTVLIFTKNKFRFEGKVIDTSTNFLWMNDVKKERMKLLHIEEIAEIDLLD